MTSHKPWRSMILGRRMTRRGATVLLVGVNIGLMLAWSIASLADSIPTRLYTIPSNSMAPTIAAGDRVGVQSRSNPRPNRGEIWVFNLPAAPTQPTVTLVKRVIGLPGEKVEVANGAVRIDGRILEEPYITGLIRYTMPPIDLGSNEYFMLGDSRNTSQDSHIWGPLPRSHFIGPVTVRVWPLKRVGGL